MTLQTDPDVLSRAVANCAGAYRMWAERLGKRSRVWDDLSCADLELPVVLPPNNATVLRQPAPGEADDLLERAKEFFAGRPGGPFELWSMWPIPELSGVEAWPVPCMIREPGGDGRPLPSELDIVEVDDATSIREAEALIDEVFEARSEPGSLLALACLDERFRVWVGRVEGRAVTTATACIAEGFVGVYAVATAPDARGHGYGEAMTWVATSCRPELPATLQASSMGRPIYERMGYRTIAEFTVWDRER